MMHRWLAVAGLVAVAVVELGCPPGANMTWDIRDACSDGWGIEVRFFDVTNSLVWPANSNLVYTANPAGTVRRTLSCVTGAQICYGARPRNDFSSDYWGVGIDGNQGCDTCCSICGAGNPTPKDLICN